MEKVANEELTYKMVADMAKKLRDEESDRIKRAMLEHFKIPFKEEDFQYLKLIVPKVADAEKYVEDYDWMFMDEYCEQPIIVNTNIDYLKVDIGSV